MNYPKLSLWIGTTALLSKIILILMFGYYFNQSEELYDVHPNEYIAIFINVVSGIGSISLLLAGIGLIKRQLGWRLYSAIPISMISILLAPFVYVI